MKIPSNSREISGEQPAWHYYASQDVETVLRRLESSHNGLREASYHERLLHYGKNTLPREQKSWWYCLLHQYTGVFSYALLAIALFYYSTGNLAESVVVLSIYTLNGLLAFWQEYRSDKALTLLEQYLEHTATVMRDGVEVIIPMSQVVPGDIVIIRAGDVVPADIRILELKRALFDESIMTGESLPIEKSIDAAKVPPATLHDAHNIAYAGTQVVQGVVVGVVIATGTNTTLGDIGMRARAAIRESAFAQEMPRLTRFIGLLLLVSLLAIFIINFTVGGLSEHNLWRFIIITVALVVATIPEALPLVITSSLAQGAAHLAQHRAVIVKRLSAVEDLGHMQILCCDKTGTLTEHKLSIANIFSQDTQKTLLYARLAGAPLSLKTTALHGFDVPIHAALTPELLHELSLYRRIDELPFDARSQTTTVVVTKDTISLVVVLGIPEKLAVLTPSLDIRDRDAVIQNSTQAGERGERVIGVAIRQVGAHQNPIIDATQPYDEYVGTITFTDPIKTTAASALITARKLNVLVKVISGDSAETCGHVAHALGLIDDPRHVMTGDEWSALSPSDRQKKLQTYHVFARCVPQQKVEIVEALKQTGMSVGYMGDGVNDMLPLKAAHVAIVVQNAPDVVREAADIILLHKSLLNVVNGIAAGRATVHNIITYVRITLATNFSNLYSLSCASLFVTFPDIFPFHMLIVNLLSDFPLVAIATDNIDQHSLATPQRFHLRSLLKGTVVLGILSSCMDILFLLLFRTATANILESSWALWSSLSEIGIIFSLRTILHFWRAARPSWQLTVLCILTAIIAIALPFTAFGIHNLGYAKLSLYDVGTILGLVGVYFACSELIKPFVFGKPAPILVRSPL